jgi:hypothetical protein
LVSWIAWRTTQSHTLSTIIGDLIDVPYLMEELRRQGEAVNRGDLTQAEVMLMNQATALQSLFARLAERAMAHTTIPGFDANMRMALRAQSQCRTTLEALAAIKNPPVVYARQANVTTGPQQVNNGVLAPRAREADSTTNELLEATHGERLDARATGAASGSGQKVETMGAIYRAED